MTKGKYKRTEETKEKMKERMKELWKNPKYREKISLSKMGDKNPMWHKEVSKETRKKIGLIHKGKKRLPFSEEWKRNMSINRKGKNMGHKYNKGRRTWSYIDGRSINPKSRKMKNGMLISHIVWCSQPENLNSVPNGFITHHLDINSENNNPNNLILLPDIFHRKLHNQIIKQLKGENFDGNKY